MNDSRVELVGTEEFAHIRREHLGMSIGPEYVVRNISLAWALNPPLMVAQRDYQDYLRHGTTLPRRDQELAILRVARACGSAYVQTQHRDYARDAGLTAAEIDEALAASVDWPDDGERVIFDVVEEVTRTQAVSDVTWRRLRERYDVAQILDLLSLIGRYWTVSVVANAVRLPLEDD